jgi:hypothetical protein
LADLAAIVAACAEWCAVGEAVALSPAIGPIALAAAFGRRPGLVALLFQALGLGGVDKLRSAFLAPTEATPTAAFGTGIRADIVPRRPVVTAAIPIARGRLRTGAW